MKSHMAKTNKKTRQKKSERHTFSPKVIAQIADEVAKTVLSSLPRELPHVPMPHVPRRNGKKAKKIENAYFLDTSAIIDGRVFDVIHLGLTSGNIAVPESILLELKHIADSQDSVKRERGRKGLALLEKLKKTKGVKVNLVAENGRFGEAEVDERLISMAKASKGKILTCDYNLEKKAAIGGVVAINVNTLANFLKVKAVPGEALYIKLLHLGKDPSQGVGYLDDGTMVVVEKAARDVGHHVDVIVSRVIQTTAGRILFAKKI